MATLTIELPEHVNQGQMIAMLETIGCDLRLAQDGRNYKAIPRQPGQGRAASQLHRIAADYREAWGHRGGYVVLFNSCVSGWVLRLDNASAWQPGCIALDEQGRQWRATGGGPDIGARSWEPVNGQQNVVRMPAQVRMVSETTPPGAA